MRYPRSFIQGVSKKIKRSRSDEQPVATVVLPYVKNVSESIRRILTPLNVRACFKLHKTLRNILVHAKGREHMNKKTGVIYQIPCGTCNEIYIGQTGRSLKHRMKEHQRALTSWDNIYVTHLP